MAHSILMDELHLQVRVTPALPPAAAAALRRHLAGRPFRARLVRAARALLAGLPGAGAVRVRLVR